MPFVAFTGRAIAFVSIRVTSSHAILPSWTDSNQSLSSTVLKFISFAFTLLALVSGKLLTFISLSSELLLFVVDL